MKDLRKAKQFLGIAIQRNRKEQSILLSQEKLIQETVDVAGMTDCTPTYCPFEISRPLSKEMRAKDHKKRLEMETRLYREVKGILLYVSLNTRPDIAAAVSIASRYVSNPGPGHWQGVQKILRFLKGTSSYGLCIQVTGGLDLIGYSNSGWAGDISTRQSTSGHIFQIHGSIVAWKSKKQNSIALSITEAEYMALSDATKELLWLNHQLDDMGLNQPSTIMNEDNQGCIALAQNPGDHPRTKHINIRFHFIRAHVQSGKMELKYIATEKNVAEIMTKPFGRIIFLKLREMLNLRDSEDFLVDDRPYGMSH